MDQPAQAFDDHLTTMHPRRAGRGILFVRTLGNDPTIAFAGDELERVLQTMTGATVLHLHADRYEPQDNTIFLGTAPHFDDVALGPVSDEALDDAIAIEVRDRRAIVTGANPRAVLIAAYRYLRELGCRWVRPGSDGEWIPEVRDPLARDVICRETPACRHRGIAIEGACSSEHVTDMIDWLPKVGMNTYFIEYFNGFIFYNNWYSQRHRPEGRKALMPMALADACADRAIAGIRKRGLLFHRAGHGWTCLPLGIPPELWDEPIERGFGEQTRYIAKYQGVRCLYRGIPRRTNLCYSNPDVRRMVVDGFVTYAMEHSEVDYLHFWLADGSNHFCECEACRGIRPADYYVMMLNEIDRALSAEQLSTRVVFLIYLDLLWPPKTERILNPDRFVMMFAPLHREYDVCFDASECSRPLPPFELNQLAFPPSQNLEHLAAWQRVFDGDSFVFDYRFMWEHYEDPGYMAVANVIANDTPTLGSVGLNGMISDQTQRAFLPSALPMLLLAEGLWQGTVDTETSAADYFSSAFGRDGQACREFLENLSAAFGAPGIWHLNAAAELPPEVTHALAEVPDLVDRFRPTIEKNTGLQDPVWARSWRVLGAHADICCLLAAAIRIQAREGVQQAMPHWNELETALVDLEPLINPVFDVFLFLLSMRRKYRVPQASGME